MAATANLTLTATWQEVASAGGSDLPVLVSLVSGRACEIAVKATSPGTDDQGHPLTRGGETGEFSGTLKTTEKLWARNRAGGKPVVLAVTK